MIEQTLGALGLNKKEVAVYLAVLQTGKITPADVSKITSINRATVYSVAKSLIKKGILYEDLGSKTLYLIAPPPNQLRTLTTRQKSELEKKDELVQQAITELSSLTAGTNYSVPKIRFIEEGELHDFLFKQVWVWQENVQKADGAWCGFQDHTFAQVYEDWIDYIWHKVHPYGRVNLISNESGIEKNLKGKYGGRDIRFWEKSQNFTATTWVVGEYVILIVTRQHPYYLVEIHDTVLSHNLREVFKAIWSQTTKRK